MNTFASALVASLAISQVAAESMYSPLKSEVSIYNNGNFPKQVTNNREKGISMVQFYKSGGKLISKVTRRFRGRQPPAQGPVR